MRLQWGKTVTIGLQRGKTVTIGLQRGKTVQHDYREVKLYNMITER